MPDKNGALQHKAVLQFIHIWKIVEFYTIKCYHELYREMGEVLVLSENELIAKAAKGDISAFEAACGRLSIHGLQYSPKTSLIRRTRQTPPKTAY